MYAAVGGTASPVFQDAFYLCAQTRGAARLRAESPFALVLRTEGAWALVEVQFDRGEVYVHPDDVAHAI